MRIILIAVSLAMLSAGCRQDPVRAALPSSGT